jgi:hypothetical protein
VTLFVPILYNHNAHHANTILPSPIIYLSHPNPSLSFPHPFTQAFTQTTTIPQLQHPPTKQTPTLPITMLFPSLLTTTTLLLAHMAFAYPHAPLPTTHNCTTMTHRTSSVVVPTMSAHPLGCQCAQCAGPNGTVTAMGKHANCTSTAHAHGAGCKCAHCASHRNVTMTMAVPQPTHVAGCKCAHCANKNGTVAAMGKHANCTDSAHHMPTPSMSAHPLGCQCAHCASHRNMPMAMAVPTPKPTSMLHRPGCKCAQCCGNGTTVSGVKTLSLY